MNELREKRFFNLVIKESKKKKQTYILSLLISNGNFGQENFTQEKQIVN